MQVDEVQHCVLGLMNILLKVQIIHHFETASRMLLRSSSKSSTNISPSQSVSKNTEQTVNTCK